MKGQMSKANTAFLTARAVISGIRSSTVFVRFHSRQRDHKMSPWPWHTQFALRYLFCLDTALTCICTLYRELPHARVRACVCLCVVCPATLKIQNF